MPHSVLPLLICCLQVVLLAWYARVSPLKIFHLFRSQSDPQIIKEIVDAVTIPVMAKVRIGHFVEAQVEPQLPDFTILMLDLDPSSYWCGLYRRVRGFNTRGR